VNEPVSKQQEKLALDRDQRVADLRAVLGTPAGRRFIWGLAYVDCRTFGTGYVSPQFDAYGRQQAFNDGRKSVGDELLAEAMAAAPEDTGVMWTEYVREAVSRARLNTKAVPSPGEASRT
jgi:hypothetical protein